MLNWRTLGRRATRAKIAVLGRNRMGESGRYGFAHGRVYVNRTALLSHLAKVYGYQSFLEIGVRRGRNLNSVQISEKVGVDPDPESGATFVMTSDAFFEKHPDMKFDLIFIDGLHTGEQVARDIANSLNALKPGGSILLHDINPPTAFDAREEFEVNGTYPDWCGTSWKGFVEYRATRPDLEMYVVDTDMGVGFIRPGRQALYRGPYESYDDLARNRVEILNLISVRDFLQRHPAAHRRWSMVDRFLS